MSTTRPRRPDDSPEHWKKLAEQDHAYHTKQFREPYRSTVHLSRFIQSLVQSPRGAALDIGCGGGANIFHLSRILTGYRWTGVDIAGDVTFPFAREQFATRGLEATLVPGDCRRLTQILPGQRFDLVLLIQTLLVTPDPVELLEQALGVTRGWLFLTSLFTDFRVDAQIAVTDYTWPPDRQGPLFYNVFSLERFRKRCEERGCMRFLSQDFDIDLELEPPENKGMGTYTRALADGSRLQFSGPIYLPWKFVAVQMGAD
jgi:SAM-dependent methyltransferase